MLLLLLMLLMIIVLQEYTNLFFVILFTFEMLMKMYALGFSVREDTPKNKLSVVEPLSHSTFSSNG